MIEDKTIENDLKEETAKQYPRILFVDDEPVILASLKSLFRKEPYSIEFTRSAAEALIRLETHHVDIIVSDMRMPGMNGTEFLKKSIDYCPDAIRIILSGYEDKGAVLEALAQGLANQYLHKPWEDTKLICLIENAVNLQRELVQKNLQNYLSSFSNLPARVSERLRLRQLLNSTNSSLDELVREIERYPALVTKLLHVSNSVYFGIRHPVATVREAIIFIGTGYVETLIIALELFQEIYKGLDDKLRIEIDSIWSKALRRANIARKIAEAWNGSGNIAGKIFIIALLQDIGLLVRIYHQPKRYFTMMDTVRNEQISISIADQRIFSRPHAEISAALLKLWNFPDDIIENIALHHSIVPGNHLVQILQIADALESQYPVDIVDEATKHLVDQWYMKLYTYLTNNIKQINAL
jgi:HD-like signal output (HDOD) protein